MFTVGSIEYCLKNRKDLRDIREFDCEQSISAQMKVLQNLLVIFENMVLNRFLFDSWADLSP